MIAPVGSPARTSAQLRRNLLISKNLVRKRKIYLFRSDPGHRRGGEAPIGPLQTLHRAAVRTSISLVFSLDIKTHCSWTGVMTFTGSKDSDFFLIKVYCTVLKTAVK